MSFARRHIIRIGFGVAVLCALASGGYINWYIQQPIQLKYQLTSINIKSPIRVNFSHEVSSHLNYNLETSLPGRWEAIHGLLGIKAIVFQPSQPLAAGSSLTLILGHVAEPISDRPMISQDTITVTTEAPAGIASFAPANGASDVSVTPTITLKLSSPNNGLRHLRLTSDAPAALTSPVSTDDTTFQWHFTGPLSQGTTYHLYLDDLNQTNLSKQRLLVGTFTTVPEPTIVATQQSHFYPGNTITIAFSQPMEQSGTDFKFNFAGTGSWTAPNTYTFTPTGLAVNQSYTYSVLQGATSTVGGVVTVGQSYTITTPGAAALTGSSPGGGSVGVATSIKLTFDQPINHASAQAAFSISPTVTGNFSWSSNTMIFTPSDYDYQTTYTVNLAAGIQSIYGLPSSRPYAINFTTVLQTLILPVPLYHQAYTLSCEEDALSMALAYRGIIANDYAVLMLENYDPVSLDTTTNSWGDPNVMFVGDVNGKTEGLSGWGSNPAPIAAASIALGRSATVADGITAAGISAQIHAGNPVVLWGYYGSRAIMQSWNSPDGVITVAQNAHVRTVIGVVGNAANPAGFYINDPIFGRLYWTTAELINNMTLGGQAGSEAVVVN